MPRECKEQKLIHSKLQLVNQEGDGLVLPSDKAVEQRECRQR